MDPLPASSLFMATEYLGLLVAWGRFCLTHGFFLTQKCDKWDRNQNNRQQATKKKGEFLLFLFVGFSKRNGMRDKKHMFWQADKCFRVSMGYFEVIQATVFVDWSSMFNSDDFSEEFKGSM